MFNFLTLPAVVQEEYIIQVCLCWKWEMKLVLCQWCSYLTDAIRLLFSLSCTSLGKKAPARQAGKRRYISQVHETEGVFIYSAGFKEVYPPCFQTLFPVWNSALSVKRRRVHSEGQCFSHAQSCPFLWNSEDKGEQPTVSFVILLWSDGTGYDIRQDAVISIQHDSRLCVISTVSG